MLSFVCANCCMGILGASLGGPGRSGAVLGRAQVPMEVPGGVWGSLGKGHFIEKWLCQWSHEIVIFSSGSFCEAHGGRLIMVLVFFVCFETVG